MLLPKSTFGKLYGQGGVTFTDSSIASEYEAFKANVDAQIAEIETKPSFNDTTITLTDKTTTLTDTNGVLANYKSINVTIDGITFTHTKGENTLTITVNEDCTLETFELTEKLSKGYDLIKDGTEDCGTSIYFVFDGDDEQNQIYSAGYNDPVALELTLNIEVYGSLELNKLNSEGDLINGATFSITSDNGYSNSVTVTNGSLTINNLLAGTYYIQETSVPEGYILDSTVYTVDITALLLQLFLF